jgi:hypothetical protein
MLESSSSCVGVHSLRGELVQLTDKGRSATLTAPVLAALDRDCTLADDYDQSTGRRAYKKGRVSKCGGRVRLQVRGTSLEDNTEESVAPSTGLTRRGQARGSGEKRSGAST